MLMSTKFILDSFESPELRQSITDKFFHQCKNWFINWNNSQIDKPTIVINEKEEAVILYCNSDLWQLVHKWKEKNLADMSFLDFVKIWKEVKNIMEKEKK